MSAVSGVNQTIIDAGGLSDQLARGLIDGRVKVCLDSYEASTLVSGSTIKLFGALPAGAKIVEMIIDFDALGSATIDVGDSNDADRYISADSVSSAGISHIENINGRGYVIGTTAGDNQILITTGSASISGTIKAAVLYTQD